MKKFWRKTWVLKLVSLLIAILVVVYINSTQTGFVTQGEPDKTKQMASEAQTIKVPLQVSVDTDKYYVVGYPEKVKVTLEGPNALVTSAVNTRNFRAYIDLTNKAVGTHQVKIKVSGLNHQLLHAVAPKTVKVDIERRKSTTMPVQIEYNKGAVASGYEIGRVSVNPGQVKVTGALGEVDQIDQIIAKPVLPKGLDHSYNRQVMLTAVDSKMHQLNVVLEPATVSVNIPITLPKKTVSLSLKPINEQATHVYSLATQTRQVTLYGSKKALSKIKQLEAKIDLRKVETSRTITAKLDLPKGIVRSDVIHIEVQVKVRKNTSGSKIFKEK